MERAVRDALETLVEHVLGRHPSSAEMHAASVMLERQTTWIRGRRAEDITLFVEGVVEENTNLQRALETRATIDQAKGIIMATMRCTPEAAFEILNEQSQRENRKLRVIAEELVAQQDRSRVGGGQGR